MLRLLDSAGVRFTPGLAVGVVTLVVKMVEGVLVYMVEESLVEVMMGTLERLEEVVSMTNLSCELLVEETDLRIIETGDGLNMVVTVETCGGFTVVIGIGVVKTVTGFGVKGKAKGLLFRDSSIFTMRIRSRNISIKLKSWISVALEMSSVK